MRQDILTTVTRGDVVLRKWGGDVREYLVTATTASGTHFWVLETIYEVGFADEENVDLTKPSWIGIKK